MEKNLNKIIVHTDGGSRGNPGPSAIGVVINSDVTGKKEYGEFLGVATNNEAEYKAVIFALKKIKQLVGSKKSGEAIVEFHIDSELVERQLNGEYKIKEENIQKLFLEVWNLRLDFGKVIFKHVFREQNENADRIVNQILDKETSKLDI